MIYRRRVLALAADGLECGQQSNLAWFRAFVNIHVALRSFLTLAFTGSGYQPWQVLTAWALIIVCLTALVPWRSIPMTRLAVVLLGIQIVGTLPVTANHVFLEFLCLGLLAFLDESNDEECELLVQALRWVTVFFFFFSGLQKLLHGRYFDGQFLAYVTATEGRFAQLFQFIMPAAEFERLRELGSPQVGSGPYRVDSLLFIALSNGVVLFEMAAPVLMIVRKTRTIAAVATIGFVLAIEAGAREIVFGAFAINLLLLFLPGPWNKRLFPIFVVFCLYLLAAAFGLVWIVPYEI